MRNAKKIEVLMATYNGAAYIREQIDSILAQTYEPWRLTISDDGSTDGTDAIIDAYVRQYPERIRRVYAGRRFGNAKEHFMWLIDQCDSEWIALSDQDDYVYPDKFQKMAMMMRQTEAQAGCDAPVLIFSDQTPTDAQLRPLCDSLMRMQKQYAKEIDWRALVFQNVATGGACMFNRALAKLACRCEDVSQIVMHDWWLAIVAARFGKVVYLDESTGCYRQHGGNCVGAKDVGNISYILSLLSCIRQIHESILNKKRQSQVFEETYCALLSRSDLAFLKQVCRKHSGIKFYYLHWKLIHGWYRKIGMIVMG